MVRQGGIKSSMKYTLNNFYQSKEWRCLRLLLMDERKDECGQILCEHCGEAIVQRYDCIGHHKNPLTDQNVNDVTISLNPLNIMLVHHICHNKIHNKLGWKEECRKVYLVYGSPISGKTTWVRETMNTGDLIVDTDSIWECISGLDRYIKPMQLTKNMFSIRDLLIEQVKHRTGNWKNAYVVGGYPLVSERERLCKTIGAEEIFIDTSREECIKRLKMDSERNKTEWMRYIDDWWRKYMRGTPHLP